MHKKTIRDYLSPEIEVTLITAIGVMASSPSSFGDDGQPGNELNEADPFILG